MLVTGKKKKTTLTKKAVRLLVLTLSYTVRPALRSPPRLSAAAVQTDTQANIQTFLPAGKFAYRLPGLLLHPAQPLFSESFLKAGVVAIHGAS